MRNSVVFLYLILFQSFLTGIYSQPLKSEQAANIYNASSLEWRLWGYQPETWRINFDFTNFTGTWAEVINIPVDVPGSVRNALLKKKSIPDWNYGTNCTASEWVENRHWLFSTKIPDRWLPTDDRKVILHCDGLDGNGIIMINGKEAGEFNNTFIPYTFDISPFLKDKNNTMVFVFVTQPDDLGQIGFTSKITDWKPRFYYGWDWVPRIVQIGIWDKVWISVENKEQPKIEKVRIIADADKFKDKGILKIKTDLNRMAFYGKIHISLKDNENKAILNQVVDSRDIVQQKVWNNLRIKRWWPNGFGEQPLYSLTITLLDNKGAAVQIISRKIGFRHIEWLPCKGAVKEADPWICSVNNTPLFLQGVNWTPIRPNFADLKEKDYRLRLNTYKKLGVNTIRVWGGGFPEKEWLYDICDELGILIWQDFPLSSSGIDNYPPEGKAEIYTMSKIVRHYIYRLQHHASILLWCGGNELYTKDNSTTITDKHEMIAEMKEILNALDPSRRFTFGSPSGPNISATRNNFGSGKNWDTHGPWNFPFTGKDKTMNALSDFWSKNDALFISEAGAPGTMSAGMITKYAGDYNPLPANIENPVWRNVNWWIDWDEYIAEKGDRASESLEDYVKWSQNRQAEGLKIAVKSMKDKFPECGGFLIWMGHDCFPCMVNTSVIDFEGNPKPAAYELSKIWKDNNLNSFEQ